MHTHAHTHTHISHRPALQHVNRHVELRLHPGRALHGLPSLPGGERGGAAVLHHGDLRAALTNTAAGGPEEKTVFWLVVKSCIRSHCAYTVEPLYCGHLGDIHVVKCPV